MKPRAGVSDISTAGLSWAQAIPDFINACPATSRFTKNEVSFETSVKLSQAVLVAHRPGLVIHG